MGLAEHGEGGEMKRKNRGGQKRRKKRRRQAEPGKWRTFTVVGSVKAEYSASVVLSHAGRLAT